MRDAKRCVIFVLNSRELSLSVTFAHKTRTFSLHFIQRRNVKYALTFHQGEYTICIHETKCDGERLDLSFGELYLKFLLVLFLVSASTRSLKVQTINIRSPTYSY